MLGGSSEIVDATIGTVVLVAVPVFAIWFIARSGRRLRRSSSTKPLPSGPSDDLTVGRGGTLSSENDLRNAPVLVECRSLMQRFDAGEISLVQFGRPFLNAYAQCGPLDERTFHGLEGVFGAIDSYSDLVTVDDTEAPFRITDATLRLQIKKSLRDLGWDRPEAQSRDD